MSEKLTVDEVVKELHKLMASAYQHYYTHSDGYTKSSESQITVRYPTYLENRDGEKDWNSPVLIVHAPNLGLRDATFHDLTDALNAVKQACDDELATVYCPQCHMPRVGCFCTL